MKTKSILFSVKPQFADAIVDGDKTFEFRRNPPLDAVSCRYAVFYATKPDAVIRVIATVHGLHRMKPARMWDRIAKDHGRINQQEFFDYFEGLDIASAIQLSDPWWLDEPLSILGLTRPPQSWQYIQTEAIEAIHPRLAKD